MRLRIILFILCLTIAGLAYSQDTAKRDNSTMKIKKPITQSCVTFTIGGLMLQNKGRTNITRAKLLGVGKLSITGTCGDSAQILSFTIMAPGINRFDTAKSSGPSFTPKMNGILMNQGIGSWVEFSEIKYSLAGGSTRTFSGYFTLVLTK